MKIFEVAEDSKDFDPKIGDVFEFDDDRILEAGPCSGHVIYIIDEDDTADIVIFLASDHSYACGLPIVRNAIKKGWLEVKPGEKNKNYWNFIAKSGEARDCFTQLDNF